MELSRLIEFSLMGDERGSLVAMDSSLGVPFNVKRAYFIFDTKKGVVRGCHAHRSLHQVAVCVSGSCNIILDNGAVKENIIMNSPIIGLDLPPMLWHEMNNFSDDCILLVLASDFYDESDYIRSYEEFLSCIK